MKLGIDKTLFRYLKFSIYSSLIDKLIRHKIFTYLTYVKLSR